MLAWLVHERGIEPHIPVFDKSARTDGTFSRSDFAYDHARDLYACPAGKELRPRQRVYRSSAPLVFRPPARVHCQTADFFNAIRQERKFAAAITDGRFGAVYSRSGSSTKTEKAAILQPTPKAVHQGGCERPENRTFAARQNLPETRSVARISWSRMPGSVVA